MGVNLEERQQRRECFEVMSNAKTLAPPDHFRTKLEERELSAHPTLNAASQINSIRCTSNTSRDSHVIGSPMYMRVATESPRRTGGLSERAWLYS